MPLPEILNVCDLEEVLAELGHAADRVNIGRALAEADLPGVVRPTARGRPWRIPRAALLDAVAACLRRRAARQAARERRPVPALEHFRVDAARRMLGRRGLAALVPRRVRAAVRRADEAALERRRLALLRERELREAREAAARREEERRRRAREAARLAREAEDRRREEAAREREWEEAYSVVFRTYLRSAGFPLGPGWMERPEARAFLAAWPNTAMGGRPRWWRPPPGLLEAVRAEAAKPRPFPYREPDHSHLFPAYSPDLVWPWRSGDAGDAAAG